MKLGEAQETFAELVPLLLNHIFLHGKQVRLGDCFRDPRAFGKVGEEGPYGNPSSNHKRKLAIDINLFDAGTYLTKDDDHRQFGEFWESLHPHCRWGGRYNDGNHYEFTQNPWRSDDG